ncbi:MULTISPECIES: deoxyguanosinetriphosphate triphosphohydrolase [Komagataeibacter]|uniref:Deoxyguanosinetriphosphate triphosphohydrolase-like protein n=2 Tax=Komagataeibacter TaxID=1434011 RepID=A0A318QZ44_9PROT|nr:MULTISPECIES: deoxyguanosinetriphosphate triphosphohydrolase [Komagataeibacter]GBR32513.1 deoxyguanosinetriphosphate triphosphohydrolase [Komagataeibacter oboediens DSM 11826]MBL7234038.1 deoxyguanosinetriphosphate triphosphohydrolase [Komagataeibacter oboediens]MBT0674005.1 deoxyguanosinetriphosphate triphosphohydrolase [Komagataeibacter oboediens]MBT0677273.1 deoxyguanosinetriphosphate triphosphohydrolase [Komagataeibacter oboediens]MBV0887204.1 deoxyguanosinetriphosphate triphosphohydrol
MSTAPYAVQTATARGRLYPEAEAPTRSPWQRDRDRVLHSAGFRTLQYKTQVFLNHEGDFFRTRLTHSLEVAQVARSIARRLGLEEDLTEGLALAHDLGHTPFGHAGEEALSTAMKPWGGFDHNTQSLRLVTLLERRYFAFDGLNLTWEMLEGLAKHNGPVDHPTPYVADYAARHGLELGSYASAEAQVAALSDDIAYHAHDLDDGLRAGLLHIEDLETLPVVREALADARAAQQQAGCHAGNNDPRLRHETIRRVINTLAMDLIGQTQRNLECLTPTCSDDIRHAARPVVAYSPEIAAANLEIRKFLYARLYRHWRVNRMTRKARLTVESIFAILSENMTLLPDGTREPALAARDGGDRAGACRVVADYIAGMTDRCAMEEYRRLTDLSSPG